MPAKAIVVHQARMLVAGGSGSDGLVYRWTLWRYAPGDDRDQTDDIVDGVLVGPGRSHEPHWREAATILDVRQGERSALLDSDEARRAADVAGRSSNAAASGAPACACAAMPKVASPGQSSTTRRTTPPATSG